MIRVQWQENVLEEFDELSGDALGKFVERVACDREFDEPVLVRFIVDNDDSMTVAVGGEFSYLNYVAGNGSPPSYSSVNDGTVWFDEDVAVFRLVGVWTEVPLDNCISIESALAGVEYFLQTGQRHPAIEWVED